MRKPILSFLSLTVLLSIVLGACDGQHYIVEARESGGLNTEERVVLNVWSFTNELKTMAVAFEERYPNVDVVYTMIPVNNDVFQTRVKASIGTADVPDVVAMDAAFVKEWVEADFLANLNDLLPLADKLKTYPAVVEVGMHDGVAKGFSYQATLGAFFFRRSIARECLSTDDLVEVQKLVADMDKFVKTADRIKDCYGGNYTMVATFAALLNPYLSNRSQPWIVDGALFIDPKVEEFVDLAKLFRDEGYESQVIQGSEGWFAGMSDTLVDAQGTQKRIFSYFMPTWGLQDVLIPNSGDTGGDWAMINGPFPFQDGGTWVGAIADSPNLAWAKEFIKFVALDEENLTNWATGVYTNQYLKAIDPRVPYNQSQAPGDFVSSQVVVEKIASQFAGSAIYDWLGGQNNYRAFIKAAPGVGGTLMTGSDDVIQDAFVSALDQYLLGEITKAEMWQLWLENVRSEFPELTIPDPPSS